MNSGEVNANEKCPSKFTRFLESPFVQFDSLQMQKKDKEKAPFPLYSQAQLSLCISQMC